MLLKVWLRQRGILGSIDGINGFVTSMILAHLYTQRQVSPRMSSYQIFKIVLEFIATTDFCGQGLAMDSGHATQVLPKFSSKFAAVFLDPSGRLNLLARAGPSAVAALKLAAEITLCALKQPGTHCFDAVFVRSSSRLLQYDEVVMLPQIENQTVSAGILELTDIRAHTHKVPVAAAGL